MKKINGFSRKPNSLQILSYFYFLVIILTYFFIIFPLSSNLAKVIYHIKFRTYSPDTGNYSSCDHSNRCCHIWSYYYLYRSHRRLFSTDKESKGFRVWYSVWNILLTSFRKNFIPIESDFHCTIDDSYVHETSKHCRKCGRYLNNKRNFKIWK